MRSSLCCNSCNFCKDLPDSLTHIYATGRITKRIINQVIQFINGIFGHPFSLNKLEIIFEIFLHDKLKNNEIIKNICIARASAEDAKKFLLICSLVAELLTCIRLFKEKSLNKVLLIL